MNKPAFQRRQVSAAVFLLFAALAAFLLSRGPLKAAFETERQVKRLEQLVQGQRTIIARSGGSQGELDRLNQDAGFQEQLLQGRSLNMAVAQAQGTLTSLVEENGGKILRVANVAADAGGSLKPVITSVNFECGDQDLNNILYGIEFGTVGFIIDRAEVRSRRARRTTNAATQKGDLATTSLNVRIDVRGFWRQTTDTDG